MRAAFDLAGPGEQRTRLAYEIERHVAHGDVFFERRRVAAPLAKALGQDQAGVGDAQQVLHGRAAVEFDGCLHGASVHMWSTDLGST